MEQESRLPRALASEAAGLIGQRARFSGWLHGLRRLGGVTFLLLRDRSGIIQAVLSDEKALGDLETARVESVIELTGNVISEPRARLGVEIHQPKIKIVSPVTEVLPFEINKRVLRPGIDVFLDNPAVGLRHSQKLATFRIGSGVLDAVSTFLTEQGFVQIKTPKIVAASTEGGSNLFRLEYFEHHAFLAQSPQLYKQIMVGALERVFEIGPVFRAEPHFTSRHINEFTSIDIEMGFIDGISDLMSVLTELLRRVFAHLLDRFSEELGVIGLPLPEIGRSIPILTFEQAQDIIYRKYREDARGQFDLTPQHERWLCRYAEEEYGSDFVFITRFPTITRPFYTMPDPSDPDKSLSFDLLFRGIELVTGGQRIHDYDQLLKSIESRSLDPKGFRGYLQAFRYGMPPEGGFAIGYERLLAGIIGADNIREAALFPRDVTRLAP